MRLLSGLLCSSVCGIGGRRAEVAFYNPPERNRKATRTKPARNPAAQGDNDPLDAVEVGFRQMGTGQAAPVRVLGVLGMLDDGEADWKARARCCE